MRSAVSASTKLPVSDISRAHAGPMRRGRSTSTGPGYTPTRRWVSAKRARSEATMKSQAKASSKPPVTAGPLTAATTGMAESATAAVKRGRSASVGTPSWRRSKPAQNAGSVPVITMAPASWASATASTVAWARVAFIALRAAGRLRRRRATAPWRSTTTGGSDIEPLWHSAVAPPSYASASGAVDAGVAFGGDPLLAHLFRHGHLVGDGLGLEAHALLRHDPLLHVDLFLVQHDLVLLARQVGPGHGLAPVGLRDGFGDDPHLLALHRDGPLDLLGLHPLAQARPAALAPAGADLDLFLRARHGVVGVRPARVVARAGAGRVPAEVGTARVGSPEVTAVTGGRGETGAEAVVVVQPVLFLLRQVPVSLGARRVLHLVLVVGDHEVVALQLGAAHRHEAHVAAEHAGVHGKPFRLPGVVIGVDVVDPADLVPVAVDRVAADPAADVVSPGVGHRRSLSSSCHREPTAARRPTSAGGPALAATLAERRAQPHR